jgi:HSP20 family molecular chaperone IbpA
VKPHVEEAIMTQQPTATTAANTDHGNVVDRNQLRSVLPAVDVFENPHGITLLADMPGVPREQLEIKVEGESLLIEGTVLTQMPQGLEPIHAEVRVPRYRRSFVLSRELDTSGIQANLKEGVLSLHIPKKAHAQARKIPVSAG